MTTGIPGFTADTALAQHTRSHFRSTRAASAAPSAYIRAQLFMSNPFQLAWMCGPMGDCNWAWVNVGGSDPGGWGVRDDITEGQSKACKARCNRFANAEDKSACLEFC